MSADRTQGYWPIAARRICKLLLKLLVWHSRFAAHNTENISENEQTSEVDSLTDLTIDNLYGASSLS